MNTLWRCLNMGISLNETRTCCDCQAMLWIRIIYKWLLKRKGVKCVVDQSLLNYKWICTYSSLFYPIRKITLLAPNSCWSTNREILEFPYHPYSIYNGLGEGGSIVEIQDDLFTLHEQSKNNTCRKTTCLYTLWIWIQCWSHNIGEILFSQHSPKFLFNR